MNTNRWNTDHNENDQFQKGDQYDSEIYDSIIAEEDSENLSSQQSTQRALSYPTGASGDSANDNNSRVKIRLGRKTRHYSAGASALAPSTISSDGGIDGTSKSNGGRQRHHRHHHHHGKAFRKAAAYKKRQKDSSQARSYNRDVKFQHGDGLETEFPQLLDDSQREDILKSSNNVQAGDVCGIVGVAFAGMVTVDSDTNYKTFKTKKQVSLPVQGQVPVLLQPSAASASFTAPSLVPLSVVSRSLSIFTGSGDRKGNESAKDEGPVFPSRQTSDGAAAATLDDRSQFHKTFSLLVQLGAEASSRKSHHYGGITSLCSINTPLGVSLDLRELRDSSEPSSLRQQQVVQFNDILWIYFQAKRYNRKLPCCYNDDLAAWLQEQDDLIYDQRLSEIRVLKEVSKFRVASDDRSDDASTLESNKLVNDSLLGKLIAVYSDGQETINSQLCREEKALEQICNLLARFEHFQTLYKSSKAMELALNDDLTTEVKDRLNILYGWSNIASDLRRKLFTIAEMLDIRKYKARRESQVSIGTTDAVSRSVSSDIGSMATSRQSSMKSPSTKLHSDGSGLHSPKSASSNTIVTRSGSIDSSPPRTSIIEVMTALLDVDYLKAYAERCLKLRGMRKVLSRVAKIYGQTLWRARQILQCRCFMPTLASFWKLGDTSDSPSSPFLRLHRSALLECETDISKCYISDKDYQSMNLPTTFPIYFSLLRVPLDLVYVWLNLRLEQKVSREPDRLATNQLIQDARDCLEAATEVKSFYQDYVQAVVGDQECLEKLLVDGMSEFDEALKKMFELYLHYVHRWIQYQCASGIGTRGISREQNQTVIKFLEDEWRFARRISVNVLFGEAEAAQKFCHMNTAVLMNLEELLENSLDEARNRHFEDDCKSDHEDNDQPVDELNLSSSFSSSLSSEDGFQLSNNQKNDSNEYDDGPTILVPIATNSPARKISSVFEQCRRLKTTINEVRNLSNRSIALAKLLRHDLEVAAKFQVIGPYEAILKRMQETGHFLLKTPARSPEYLLFSNAMAAKKESYLQLLLNVTCGRDDRFGQMLSRQTPKQDTGYLLLVNCGEATAASKWSGNVKEVALNADSNLALNHMDIEGLYLVVADSSLLAKQVETFLTFMSPNYVRLIDEQCSCHTTVAENMNEMKDHAVKLRQCLADWLRDVAIELKHDRQLNELDDNERQTYRDVLIQAYSVAFEYHRELMRLMNASSEGDIVHNLANFALQWCEMVTEVCDEGQGCRPRWATDGINYLVQVADPKITSHLDNKEFEELQRAMQKCLSHIIGSRSKAQKAPLGGHSISLTDTPPSSSSCPSRNTSRVSLTCNTEKSNSRSNPSSIRGSRDDLHSDSSDNESTSKRIMRKVTFYENSRDDKLRREYRLIGRCVDRSEVQAMTQIPLKRAGFRWQRLQHFVGRGRYGSVYTALNLDTSQLMAVKQQKLQRKQDHQALQQTLDEINNFSKIQHPNLVRYFGAEVHQDELLIFMEYCNEGTLADACKDGMSEELVRFYTSSLLQAVGELHKHNIVHRDIKPANIFLMNDHRLLKLGDFGCSVRLQGDETMVGELTVYVGSPAYMAPEVICATDGGYGRATDIWSVGCVVLEMITGKPPWHDLTEPMAIVYRVGMGGVPDIPTNLREHCLEFLRRCLENKPSNRWSVDRLMELPFVKVTYNG